jgi:hypothetical protein
VPTASPDNAGTATALNSGAIHLLRGLRAADRQSGLTPARLSALSVLVFGGPTSLGRLDGERLMRAAAQRRIDVISSALDALPPKDRQLLHRAAPALAPLAVAVKRVLDS